MRKCRCDAPEEHVKEMEKYGSHPVAVKRYKWDEDFIYLEMAFFALTF